MRSFQRAPPAAKRVRVAADLFAVPEARPQEVAPLSAAPTPEAHPQEVVPPPTAPITEAPVGVESYVEMMIRDIGHMPTLSPERSGLQRVEEGGEIGDQRDQTIPSPPRGPGRGVVLSDEEEVQELSPETARQQPTFGEGYMFEVPESSSTDGSNFFRRGYTIHPLCPRALEQARQEGTSDSAAAFSYHMSQVCFYCEFTSFLFVF